MKIAQFVNNLTKALPPRQKEILIARYGLETKEEKTLQEIGDKYGITRERVRQIEEESLKKIRGQWEKSEGPRSIDAAFRLLKQFGGLRREDYLLRDLAEAWGDKSLNLGQMRLIFELSEVFLRHPADEKYYSFWRAQDISVKSLDNFIKEAVKIFTQRRREIVEEGREREAVARLVSSGSRIGEKAVLNYLSVSKKFSANTFGNFGLTAWNEINPRTVKHKAYLVVKKHGKPLHFRDIAKRINEQKIGGKPALPQTVHNEVIKDPRFVLVGRGIYGLKEHGFYAGTAREVLRKILKKEGPLSFNQLVKSVAEQRVLRENTIFINLQNKKHFKKMPDGRYYCA